MPQPVDSSTINREVPWCAIAMGAALYGFHLLVNGQYGFHGDELYFLVCGERPAWGYVDHPPFVPMVARFATGLFGTSLFALRLFPALALGIGCALTGWLARRLGAGVFGEALACLAFIASPLLIRFGAFLNIPCFEVLFWLIVAHLVVTLIRRDNPRWWLAVGAVCGLVLLNKHTTLFLGTGLAVGILATGRRRDLRTPWPWAGGALALFLFAPNLWWQYQHDWATLEFVRSINESAMGSRGEFVLGQFLLMNLANFSVFLAGLAFCFHDPAGRPYRLLGWVFLTVLGVMLLFGAKVYYLVPAYPLLMAGGAVWIESRTQGRPGRYPRAVLVTAIAGFGLLFVPIMAPVGSLEWKERYIGHVLGFALDAPRDLTFDFHYQGNRPEELAALKRVYDELPPSVQLQTFLLTKEYDSASAVNILGEEVGLPEAFSGNNNYNLWGPPDADSRYFIAFGFEEAFLREHFNEVRLAGRSPGRADTDPFRPIYLCAAPAKPLAEQWGEFKSFR